MSAAPHRPTNEEIAEMLEEAAALIDAHGDDGYRLRAYRDAARTVRAWREPVIDVLDRDGRRALIEIPTIGRSIAAAIEEMAWRGRWGMLDRLRGELTPEELFMTLPGIGEELATELHERLDVETLEELEVAAHDGRLEDVPGIGPRRGQAIRDLLAAQLSRSTRRRARRVRTVERGSEPPAAEPERPSVDLLLRLDAEYRRRAEAGELATIAPRRFNEEGEPWLPIWHPESDGWRFTVLYSNSATAHRMDKTRDWVVMYWERDGHEDQATVVTEYKGPLTGQRVVRGRERECAERTRHRRGA